MHVLHNPHIIRKLFDRESYSIPATGDRVSLHKTYITEYRARQAEKSKEKGTDSREVVDDRTTNASASTAEGLQSGEYMQLIFIITILDVCHIVASTSAMALNRGRIAHSVSGIDILIMIQL